MHTMQTDQAQVPKVHPYESHWEARSSLLRCLRSNASGNS